RGTPSSSSRTTCSRPRASVTAPRSSPCSAMRKATPARACSSSTGGRSKSSKTPETAAPRPTSPGRWAEAVNRRGLGCRAAGWLSRRRAITAGFAGGAAACLGRPESQPPEQQRQRHDQATEAVPDERGIAADVPDQPGEVLAEEAGDERQRQEDRRQH